MYEAVGRVVELSPIVNEKSKRGVRFFQYGTFKWLDGKHFCNARFTAYGMQSITRCSFTIGAYGILSFRIGYDRDGGDTIRNLIIAVSFKHMTETGYRAYLEELRKRHLYAPRKNWKIELRAGKGAKTSRETETYEDNEPLPLD